MKTSGSLERRNLTYGVDPAALYARQYIVVVPPALTLTIAIATE
jgi:hypothetical protein